MSDADRRRSADLIEAMRVEFDAFFARLDRRNDELTAALAAPPVAAPACPSSDAPPPSCPSPP
jgi:hypothetical protein